MTKENIKLFILERLKNCKTIDVKDIQQYILNCDEVGKAVDANEIDLVLEDMAFAQKLIVISGYKFNRLYRKTTSNDVKIHSDKVIAIDVDDVCVELVDYWLEIYNHDHADNLTKENIISWDIGSFTKIGDKFYEYLKKGDLYENVKLVPGALNGIKKIKGTGARVIFITAGFHPRKFDFLVRSGFVDSNDDYVIAHDKSLINADILIDDKYENIRAFPSDGILLDKPWNKSYNGVTRAMDWKDIDRILFGTHKQKNKRIW